MTFLLHCNMGKTYFKHGHGSQKKWHLDMGTTNILLDLWSEFCIFSSSHSLLANACHQNYRKTYWKVRKKSNFKISGRYYLWSKTCLLNHSYCNPRLLAKSLLYLLTSLGAFSQWIWLNSGYYFFTSFSSMPLTPSPHLHILLIVHASIYPSNVY